MMLAWEMPTNAPDEGWKNRRESRNGQKVRLAAANAVESPKTRPPTRMSARRRQISASTPSANSTTDPNTSGRLRINPICT
jgi:hypothetical protein